MSLSGKQKRYLRKNLKRKSLAEIASDLNLSEKEIETYLQKIWGEKKYQKFINKRTRTSHFDLKKRIIFFDFKSWFDKNLTFLIVLTLLVFVAYFNSLFNEFVSDDVAGILKSPVLDKFSHIFDNPPLILRPFIFFIINKFFGRLPFFFRIFNILFHLGSVLTFYLIISILIDSQVAFLASLIFAVHPVLTESISWISGGAYVQYSFFLLLSIFSYLFSLKNRKCYFFSIISFITALMFSEKAIVFPFSLLALVISFGNLKKDRTKLIPFFLIGGCLALFFVIRVPQRISDLETIHYQSKQTLNPLIQIPIAITSYLELFFWPQKLTLYHSEMVFSLVDFFLRATLFIGFLGIIIYSFFKKHYQLFFWLSFFIISLLPTLTPFGISWVVAERYAYLGSIGIFIVVGLGIKRLMEKEKLKILIITLFSLLITVLCLRTIRRNIDWKNEDSLWLASAKTSPSSPQNHNNLGDYYGRHGELERAAEEFKKAIELKAGYADAYHNLANTYGEMGKIEEAIENYKQALEFNPNLWQSHQNLAEIYFKQEDFGRAKEELEKAIKVNPQEANLHTNLGFIYVLLKEKDKAKIEFKKALELNPQNERAKQGLAELVK